MKHWTLSEDPNAEREAKNYENPVPSREYLLERLQAHGQPITYEEMIELLGIEEDDPKEAVRRRLIAMARDGQILKTPQGAYEPIDPSELIEGRVIGHRDGIGFLARADGEKPDLILPPRQMRRVFDGDIVIVRISGRDRRGRPEGTIVDIVESRTQTLTGIYRDKASHEQGFAALVPESSRITQEILIDPQESNGAKDGQVVSVNITQQPTLKQRPQGEVVEVLGERMDPGMEIQIAIREHDIPDEFPPEVEEELRGFSAQVRESDKHARVDIRDLPLVTIDGEDAKDFDDAVYAYKTRSGGWKLIVAIADVSYYVGVDSALDNEARNRGNSVYFPGQVVPMLPELLSNGLCSINPDVDRLCMVCEMNISQKGEISRYKFYEGLMRSHARLTYTKVGAMMETPESDEAQALKEQYKHVYSAIEQLHGLYGVLREARTARGAIDFETTETQIVFNDERKIEKIVPRSRNVAHKMIEECMLAANVATARFLDKHKLPALYRVHQRPSADRLQNLKAFLAELGLSLGGEDEPTPKDYQVLREAIANRPDIDIIQTVMLRSMMQAVYSPFNEGHFGLAYTAYAHFTSPIRRYPDLLVHRAIRSVIRSGVETTHVERVEETPVDPTDTWLPYNDAQMIELGEHCSMTERRADEATRDVEDWLKCEFMVDKVGEVLDGKIASVTQFGLFIRLDDYFVEGLVHISALPSDYYQFQPERHQLRGERSGTTYQLGGQVTVQVARVDLDTRKIDFILAGDSVDSSAKSSSKASKNARKTRTDKVAQEAEADEGKSRKRRGRMGRRERERLKRKKGTSEVEQNSAGNKEASHAETASNEPPFDLDAPAVKRKPHKRKVDAEGDTSAEGANKRSRGKSSKPRVSKEKVKKTSGKGKTSDATAAKASDTVSNKTADKAGKGKEKAAKPKKGKDASAKKTASKSTGKSRKVKNSRSKD